MNFLETFDKIFKDSSFREEQKQNILSQIKEQDINNLETNDLCGMYYIMQIYAHDLDDNMLKKYYDIENKLW